MAGADVSKSTSQVNHPAQKLTLPFLARIKSKQPKSKQLKSNSDGGRAHSKNDTHRTFWPPAAVGTLDEEWK